VVLWFNEWVGKGIEGGVRGDVLLFERSMGVFG
jgi:hypothetical protein